MGGGIPSWLSPRGPKHRKKKFLPPIETLETQLCYSARNRDLKGLRQAIQNGAGVNTYQDGDNALHWAAFWGDRESAQLLMEAGADPQLTNRFGRFPIEDAYRGPHRDLTKLLEMWKKKGTAQLVSRKRRAMEWAVRKQQAPPLREFIDKESHNFLIQIHAQTAEDELGRIVKQQNLICEKLLAAQQAQDISTLQVHVATANEMDSMVGPPRYPGLVEAEARLREMLELEDGFKRKLQRIEMCEFKDANIPLLEKALAMTRANPIARRLNTTRAAEVLHRLKAEAEIKEEKLSKMVSTIRFAKRPGTAERAVLEECIEEFSPMKPMRTAIKEARSLLESLPPVK